jgi:hypothetical protein
MRYFIKLAYNGSIPRLAVPTELVGSRNDEQGYFYLLNSEISISIKDTGVHARNDFEALLLRHKLNSSTKKIDL